MARRRNQITCRCALYPFPHRMMPEHCRPEPEPYDGGEYVPYRSWAADHRAQELHRQIVERSQRRNA
jgi:hypothetical protein